jgi:hypothetical protein
MSGSFIGAMTEVDVYVLTMYPMEHPHFGSVFIQLDDSAEYKEYTPQKSRSLTASGPGIS